MSLFDNIEKKTNVKMDDVFKLADSVKDANFKDEQTVRNLIKQVSMLAGKPVNKEKEDKIVKAIVENNMPMDLNTIGKMFKK
ncbi:stage VI sporulation protein F [Bacillus salitolerans]|uniref:Stage VI sporulation protein F n=1 Tax=Bacillus salitolerans TaxID=1437434 RepID=A0ABW4LUT8_9BACI